MKTVKVNGNLVQLYDSIDDMPITRFQVLNRFAAIDAGIGSDLEAMDRHISTILRHSKTGDSVSLAKTCQNLRQCLTLVLAGVNPEALSFACTVYSINNKVIVGDSDHVLESIITELSKKGLTMGKMRAWFGESKKKLMQSLKYFSQNSAQVRENVSTTTY